MKLFSGAAAVPPSSSGLADQEMFTPHLTLALGLLMGSLAVIASPAQALDRSRSLPGEKTDATIYTLSNTVTLERTPDGIEVHPANFDQRFVTIELGASSDTMILRLETTLRLWKIPDGLRRLEWPVKPGVTFSREDVAALAGVDALEQVPTWGASVDWPGLGPVTLVVFRMGADQYGGLLSSAPSGVNTMHQMVFQRARPSTRPRSDSGSAHQCPQC